MTKRSDPYFSPIEEEATKIDVKIEPDLPESDPYFTPIDDHEPLPTPESIESEVAKRQGRYEFVRNGFPETKTLKHLVIISVISLSVILVWQAYTTAIALFTSHYLLGIGFATLLVALLLFSVKALYRFKQSQRQVARIEGLREQANSFINERSQGNSSEFVAELNTLYAGMPQHHYLNQAIQGMPDYLNDEEVIERLSSDFFSHLDEEAKQLITQHSVTTATLVAVSQELTQFMA